MQHLCLIQKLDSYDVNQNHLEAVLYWILVKSVITRNILNILYALGIGVKNESIVSRFTNMATDGPEICVWSC